MYSRYCLAGRSRSDHSLSSLCHQHGPLRLLSLQIRLCCRWLILLLGFSLLVVVDAAVVRVEAWLAGNNRTGCVFPLDSPTAIVVVIASLILLRLRRGCLEGLVRTAPRLVCPFTAAIFLMARLCQLLFHVVLLISILKNFVCITNNYDRVKHMSRVTVLTNFRVMRVQVVLAMVLAERDIMVSVCFIVA